MREQSKESPCALRASSSQAWTGLVSHIAHPPPATVQGTPTPYCLSCACLVCVLGTPRLRASAQRETAATFQGQRTRGKTAQGKGPRAEIQGEAGASLRSPVPAGSTGRAWLRMTGRHSPAEPLSAANLMETQRPCLQSGLLTRGTWAWITVRGSQEAGVQWDPHAPKAEAQRASLALRTKTFRTRAVATSRSSEYTARRH